MIRIAIDDRGVQDVGIDVENAADHQAAHKLLGKLSFEIRALDLAAKSAGEPEEKKEI